MTNHITEKYSTFHKIILSMKFCLNQTTLKCMVLKIGPNRMVGLVQPSTTTLSSLDHYQKLSYELNRSKLVKIDQKLAKIGKN